MSTRRCASATVVLTAGLVFAGCAARGPSGAAKQPAAGTEERFSTPKEAVDAVLAACRTDDEARLLAIFGEEARPIVGTGDHAADHERCQRVLTAAQEMTRVDPIGPDKLQLVLGTDDWPFPAPLVKDGKRWRFDTTEGMEEIRRRQVGADELEAISACRTYVRAQEEYASRGWGGSRAYAQRLESSPGKKDGLYWPSTGKNDASPLGRIVVPSAPSTAQATWRGYDFRILTAQGSGAPGGQRSYVHGGKMTGGFAIVAYPVAYGSSGIMTFIVGADGQVYEKDLGEKTAEIAPTITEYDPDQTWKLVRG